MKTFLILALSLSAATSWASLKECRQYSADVLRNAVTEDLKATDTHKARMNKDEKKSLEFINKFDVKKLGLKLNKDERTKLLTNCEKLANANPNEVFCNNSFEIFNYFRAFTHAVKNYGWSAASTLEARKQIYNYINEVIKTEASLLDTMMATEVLLELAKTNKAKNLDLKAITQLSKDLDKANIELKESAMSRTGPMNCKDFQGIAAQEIKLNATYVKRLAALNKGP